MTSELNKQKGLRSRFVELKQNKLGKRATVDIINESKPHFFFVK